MPLMWLGISLVLYFGGAVASLLLHERAASRATAITGGLGALAGIAASWPVLIDGHAVTAVIAGPFPFAPFVVRIDALAALMVFAISLVAAATSVFGVAYVEEEYAGRGIRAMGFFMNLFIASMMLVVVSDNAMWFFVFFEMMSLTSYVLVIFKQDDQAVAAGRIYFIVAHVGAILILMAFLLLFAKSGSLDFAAFRGADLSATEASVVFLLAFFGFGAKAGMIPIHIWLPRAHPAAPSHASALMSGVMVKIGVFGIVKVGVEFLGATTLWWGLLVLAFGAVSAVLGVIYALAEHDIKRLLAYHSVENVGIILMGVGIGMVGIASGQPALAALGLIGALYHLLNHAVFKSLLFLSAGAVISRMHSKNMERMGGLLHRMPGTALAFLIGALAICAIPPLNGFVSEWLTYQAFFIAAKDGSMLMRLVAPLSAVMLGVAGALAVMCFVKAFGVTFSGQPRSAPAASATEVKWPMLAGMGLLAACCVLFGLGALVVAPVVGRVAGSLTGHSMEVASGLVVFPGDPAIGQISTPLIALLLIGVLGAPLIITGVFAGRRPKPRIGAEVWAAGYAPDAQMIVSAASFAQPVRVVFGPLYRLRSWADDCLAATRPWFARLPAVALEAEALWDRWMLLPIGRGVQASGEKLQILEGGDFRVYCLYIVATLIGLLILVIG